MAEKTSSVIPTISVRHWATVDSDELMPAGRPLTSQRASRRDPMASARVVSCPLQNLAQRPRLRRAVRGSPTVACRRAAYACGVWPQLTKEPRVAATAPGAERASGPAGSQHPGSRSLQDRQERDDSDLPAGPCRGSGGRMRCERNCASTHRVPMSASNPVRQVRQPDHPSVVASHPSCRQHAPVIAADESGVLVHGADRS
jgi:hypothetical protein